MINLAHALHVGIREWWQPLPFGSHAPTPLICYKTNSFTSVDAATTRITAFLGHIRGAFPGAHYFNGFQSSGWAIDAGFVLQTPYTFVTTGISPTGGGVFWQTLGGSAGQCGNPYVWVNSGNITLFNQHDSSGLRNLADPNPAPSGRIHIAVTNNFTGVRTLYVNGVAKATDGNGFGSNTDKTQTGSFRWSSAASGTLPLTNGAIEQVIHWNRVLSDNEVYYHYLEWLAGYPSLLNRPMFLSQEIINVYREVPRGILRGVA